MKSKSLYLIAFFTAAMLALAGCDKDDDVVVPPQLATFTGLNSAVYFVLDDPNSVYQVPVGVSTVSDKDRTINFTVSSPTGAQEGQQYTLGSTSVTIPAGEAVGYIDVRGIFAGFPQGRVDTLRFTLSSGEVAPSDYNNTFDLVMQAFCEVDLSAFSGEYTAQDYDDQGNPDGTPYTVLLEPGTASGNTGYVMLTGLWGVPLPFRVDMNWENPANITTTVPDQDWFVHSQYGQVRIQAAGNGTFSSCDNSMRINYEPYVPNLGTFGAYFTILQK